MSTTPFNPDPPDTDRLLELCRRRVKNWEGAEPGGRREYEQAEAFTRAFAELDAALSDGGVLPSAWAGASHVITVPDPDDDGGIYPVKELLGDHQVRIEHERGQGA